MFNRCIVGLGLLSGAHAASGTIFSAKQRVVSQSAVFVAAVIGALGFLLPANAQVNVTQYHNHYTRDGLYIDPDFTAAAAANVARDLNFSGTISGNVRAQPLYVSSVSGGPPMIIAVTESDNVYALNATNGNAIWHESVGTAVTSGLDCSDSINPMGITGTPVVDLATRSLLFDAISTPNGGTTIQHLIYSLNVDTGATNSGWPVSVGAVASYNGTSFVPSAQTQLSAVTALNGYVYVTYCGCGDSGTYYGWIVGVEISNPANVKAWAVGSRGGGSWGVGGPASDDGTNVFIATGNSYNPSSWTGGEAILRFQPGPVFSGLTSDYWVPTNWQTLDTDDNDLGSSAPLIMDVPGATPSALVVALGKDGNGYLLNRANLGGITAPMAQKALSLCNIDQAAATYQTALGTYFVCNVSTTSSTISTETQLLAVRITPTSPPTMSTIWTNSENGRASPFVTSTDGTNNMIVWGLGSSGGDERLHGFNADTGAAIYTGGGANELMANIEKWNSGIVAMGRIYVATDNKVYAFDSTAPAVQLVFSTPPATSTAGTEIGGAGTGFTVQVEDADGNIITGAGTNITISLASGAGSLAGTLTVATGSGGSATFNVTNTVPGPDTITASSSGLASVTSSTFNINAAAPNQMVFVQQPTTITSGDVIWPAVTVQLQDAFGNNVALAGVAITMSLTASSATLSGTTSVTTDNNGVATFANLVATGSGTGTLHASSTGLTTANSQSFTTALLTIPTLSEWGLIVMGLLLLIVGSLYLSRRGRVVTPWETT